jgi:alkylhydroperoxidase family enzyme
MADVEMEQLVAELKREHKNASEAGTLTAADRKMLAYAVKLTRTPAAIERADVERLNAAGFDDRAVHDICAIAAYYAFVNRIADGLGVELEPRFAR